jgi:CysZ protein
MVLEASRAALTRLFTAEFRAVFWKSLGMTLAALALLWLALQKLFDSFALPWIEALLPGLSGWAGWLGLAAAILLGVGLALALALLIAPVTALVAGFFLDDVADIIERTEYPADPPGRAMPLVQSAVLSVKFLGIVILGNIVALLLLLVPGVNLVAFFVVNGYLLGRQFFEFAAMRFRSEAGAKALRRRNAGTVFLAGLVIAAFLAIPLLNLLTPLFAAALMVHLHKRISLRERSRSVAGARAGLIEAR